MKSNIVLTGKVIIFGKMLEIGAEAGWFQGGSLKLFSLSLFETYEGASGKIKGFYLFEITLFLFSIETFVYWE